MKKYITIALVFLFSLSGLVAQTEYSISSNPGTPSSNYTLEANTNYSINFNVFIDGNSTLKGFKTTFDGTYELTWDLTKFNKNQWIEIAHTFTTTSELVNPALKIDMIDDSTTGFGNGTFYIDDIRIYDRSTLSIEDLEAKIKVFPNPVSDVLTIKNINADAEVYIHSILGASFKVKLNTLNTDSATIDMSNFSDGVYFLKIIEDNKVLTKKIIKD